jgi:adenosine deaminase
MQVIRTLPPAVVFAQSLLGFELAHADPRVVGVNFVAPEDDPIALGNYDLHMRMLEALAQLEPPANVSLHAGELTLGLVPPADLRFHIRHAIEIAHAKRIGHGVDVAYEADAPGLLREMARRRVLVEICLTSNDVILGVRGAQHPLPTYLRYGVPVALATDDEGVSRIDLTHEFVRAETTYGFPYATFKQFVRNSIEFGFLAPKDKARLKAKLEADLISFENAALGR